MSLPVRLNLPQLGVLILSLVCGIWLIESYVAQRRVAAQQQERQQVLSQASKLRASLEQSLSATAYLARGLVGFLRAVEEPVPEQVEAALSTIAQGDGKIRNIGLAPDNVLRYLYPLKDNEKALGLRYADLPAQWPSVELAMQRRDSVLAGPVDLVQGGRAVINRTPVYREDGSYWGIISMVIDLDKLVEAAELEDISDGLEIALQSVMDVSRGNGWILPARPGLTEDALRLEIAVPGGHWMLFARPSGGWHFHAASLWITRVALSILLLLLISFVLALIGSLSRSRSLASRLGEANEKLSSNNETLQYLARFDPLTNLPNRRYFDETLARTWGFCERQELPLSVLMVDVDHFKAVNDQYGHAVGDRCLERVASLILKNLQRGDDFAARYGGEEFVVLLPGSESVQAMALAEKIRRAIAGTLILPDGADSERSFRITASVGVATHLPGEPDTAADTCREADQALYAAKRAGRNCVMHGRQLAAR